MKTRTFASYLLTAVVLPLAFSTACSSNIGSSPAPASHTIDTSAKSLHRPTTEEACDVCNGTWGVHGIEESPSCVCPTTDAGKLCSDGLQCEGLCVVADGAPLEVVGTDSPPRG